MSASKWTKTQKSVIKRIDKLLAKLEDDDLEKSCLKNVAHFKEGYDELKKQEGKEEKRLALNNLVDLYLPPPSCSRILLLRILVLKLSAKLNCNPQYIYIY